LFFSVGDGDKRRRAIGTRVSLADTGHAQQTNIPTSRPGAPKEELDNYLHAEDTRIYGTTQDHNGISKMPGFPKDPWPDHRLKQPERHPTKVIETRNDDSLWNIEHGDAIHPLAFIVEQNYPMFLLMKNIWKK
jgi:hypothetical protein